MRVVDRWAFVDFTNTEGATDALVNPKNHFLDGRKLVIEYASRDAVRRGGNIPRSKDKDRKDLIAYLKQEVCYSAFISGSEGQVD